MGSFIIKYSFFTILLLLGWNVSFAQLTANFTADQTSGCAPLRVIFSDLSTGNPDRWRWESGDGRISSARNASFVYFDPGVYTISLTVYRGTTDSAVFTRTAYINVYGLPLPEFTANGFAGCSPFPVTFTDQSTAVSGTISSWRWDFGDGFLGSGSSPIHIYRSSGLYNVTLTATNNFGCERSITKSNYIRINDSVNARFSIVSPASCAAPVTVQFNDNSIGIGINSWSWDFGDGNTSTARNPSHTYASQGNFSVRLIIVNNQGCSDTIIRPNAINTSSFSASFTGPSQICRGQGVNFINTSSPLGQVDSVRWEFGDGTTSGILNPLKAYSNAGTFNIRLTSYFGACLAVATGSINVLPGPTTNFSGSPLGSCAAPLTVNFTNQSTAGTIERWIFGNGQISSVNNPVITYNNPGSYSVSLITRGSNGCYDTLRRMNYVNIAEPRVTGISGLPFEGCFPWTNTFNAIVNSPEPVVSWEWDFGDGRTSAERNPTITYTDRGYYEVKVVITTTSGCTDTLVQTVQGGYRPSATFTADPLFACPSESVSFSSNATGNITRFEWEFGDGGSSEASNPNYKYNDTGYMSVVLRVYDFGCMDSAYRERYIYITPPISRFGSPFNCVNQFSRNFFDSSIGALTWEWDFGDGTTSALSNPSHTFADTGLYQVKLTVRDTACEHASSKDIRVLREKADFVTRDTGTCRETRVFFEAKGPQLNYRNIIEYRWNFSDGTIRITTDSVISRIFTRPQILGVQLIITDLNGCQDTINRNVDIRFYGPIANFGPRAQAHCVGNLASFTDSTLADASNPIVKWTWNFGTGGPDSVFTAPGPFGKVYYDTGFFAVKLRVEDALGCTDSIIVPRAVRIFQPIADFNSPDTLICINAPVNFVNTSTGYKLTYEWLLGEGDKSNAEIPVKRFKVEGMYDIGLKVTDSTGCTSEKFEALYITVADAVAEFSVSDSFSSCPPLLVSFTNKSKSNMQNLWDFGNGNTSTLRDPSHTYTFPGDFKAMLIAVGNGGCSDTAFQNIKIEGPRGTFNYGPLSGCPPLSVNFTANAQNTNFITWDFSDGETESTTNNTIAHSYRNPGTYVPRVILEDGKGCRLPVLGIDTVRVVGARALIEELPRYEFCDSVTILFTDSTITNDVIRSWLWEFGDGTSSNLQFPMHAYNQPGRYTVSLTVSTVNECTTVDYLPNQILVAPSPRLNMGGDSTFCLPSSVQFAAQWQNPDTTKISWQWNFGNGNTSNLAAPPPVLYGSPGTYLVSLTATNNYGCTDTLSRLLNVNDTPRVTANPASFICLGQSITLTAAGALTYQWNDDPTLSCTDCSNPQVAPGSTTTYRVTGTDANGCYSSDSVLIRVMPPSIVTAEPGDTICIGESVNLRSDGATVYRWEPAAGLSATNIPNPVARPNITTNYRVIGTDVLGCFYDTLFVPIVVYPYPTVEIAEKSVSAPTGTPVILRSNASPDVIRWRWAPPAGLSCVGCPAPEVILSQQRRYTLTVWNQGNCEAKDEVEIIPTCTPENMFVPNTFSPNGDGRNDIFFPRGKGIAGIRSMRIFNRWGELLYEKKDFMLNDPTAGWNGTHRGVLLTPDVYVYTMVVVCENNKVFDLKGNLTLIR